MLSGVVCTSRLTERSPAAIVMEVSGRAVKSTSEMAAVVLPRVRQRNMTSSATAFVSVTAIDAVLPSATGTMPLAPSPEVSSLRIVSVRSVGADTPWPPLTEPLTVTSFSGPTTSSASAVTVTVPVLVSAPAAMLSMVPRCVKSASVAGATGAADTVTVTDSLDGPLNAAVTVVEPVSVITELPSRSDTVGGASSSVMVTVPAAAGSDTWSAGSGSLSVTVNVSSASSTASCLMVTVMVPVVAPAGMVNLPLASV